jgi:iron complex outermembrane receptor protein
MSRPVISLYFKPTLLACAISMALPALAQTAAAPTTLGDVVVSASADASAEGLTKSYAGGQVARGGRVGILGNQDMMDTPFSGTAYTNELIQNQQARSVADVLQNDPTVRVARGFGNFQELYVIRGFPVYSDDVAYNGLYGMLPRQYVATELVERVEVFRGANTFLNGAAPGGSGLGGAINLLPKRATNEPLTQLTVGTQTGGQYYGALDVARRFGPDQATGVRFNAAKRSGGTGVDNEDRDLSVFALGLDWRSRDVRLSADIGYQKHRLNQPRPSVTPNATGVPLAPDASRNFAQPWTFSEEKDIFGTFRAEVDLDDKTTAWAAFGMRQGDEYNSLLNPTIVPGATASGNTTGRRFDNVREETAKTAEIGIRSKLVAGPVSHSLVASASVFSLDKKNAFAQSTNGAGGIVLGNIYNPVHSAAPPLTTTTGGDLSSPLTTNTTDTSSVAVADTMGFINDRLLVTLGARYQVIENKSFSYTTGAQSSAYSDSKVTPVGGFVYKATNQVSVYGNYIEALVAGDTAAVTYNTTIPVTNAGTAFAPYVTKQTEAGVKYDGGRFGGGISIFSAERPSMIYEVNGPLATASLSGEQRNRGIELSMFGEPAKGLRLLGGISFLDAKQTKSQDGQYDGKDVIGSPDKQANLGIEWDIPGLRGLTVSGRALYTASQYADQLNTMSIPSWTRYDLGARYLTDIGGKLVTFRAQLNNVTDRDYWASVGGASVSNRYLVLGAPRTFVVSATVDF